MNLQKTVMYSHNETWEYGVGNAADRFICMNVRIVLVLFSFFFFCFVSFVFIFFFLLYCWVTSWVTTYRFSTLHNYPSTFSVFPSFQEYNCICIQCFPVSFHAVESEDLLMEINRIIALTDIGSTIHTWRICETMYSIQFLGHIATWLGHAESKHNKNMLHYLFRC